MIEVVEFDLRIIRWVRVKLGVDYVRCYFLNFEDKGVWVFGLIVVGIGWLVFWLGWGGNWGWEGDVRFVWDLYRYLIFMILLGVRCWRVRWCSSFCLSLFLNKFDWVMFRLIYDYYVVGLVEVFVWILDWRLIIVVRCEVYELIMLFNEWFEFSLLVCGLMFMWGLIWNYISVGF